MNVKIALKYINNFCRKEISVFEFHIDKDSDLSDFVSKIKIELKNELIHDFNYKRLYVISSNETLNLSKENLLTAISKENELTICYSEIIAPSNAAHICNCELKNHSVIYFDIFPREQNHRYKPHTRALYGKESMDITIEDEPKVFSGEFTGNNRGVEKIAIKYVKEHKDFFIKKWNEFVESQFE